MDQSDRNSDEERLRERRRRDNLMITRSVITTFNSIFQRQKNVDDLMLRSCLFVDKLSLALEIVSATLQAVIDNEIEEGNLDSSIGPQIISLRKTLGEELDALMNYCRTPSFSADAPFGAHLVKETAKRFENNASANDQ